MTDENKSIDENEEDLSEPSRYDSAESWDPYKKYRKAAAKFTRDWLSEPTSPFRVLNGDEIAKTSTQIKEPGQLFGSLWREGEVAVLFGETATGKSILATQIAEQIARGARTPKAPLLTKEGWQRLPLTGWFSDNSPSNGVAANAQPVLYLDFERTLAQFQERYSVHRRATSDRRIKYRFSKNFNRVDLGHFEDAANDIKGDLSRFLLEATYREIRNHPARVVIIDNISYLSRATGNSAGVRLMKTLKLWSGLHGIAILAVAQMKDRRKTGRGFGSPPGLRRGDDASSAGWFGGVGRAISLADLPPYASLADTVFAIAPSSMAPDIRYIKHLKSNSVTHGQKRDSNGACIPDNIDTLVFRLERQPEPGATATGLLNSPPELGGVAAASADGVVVLRLERQPEPGAIATECRSPHDSKGIVSTDTEQLTTYKSENSQFSLINSQLPANCPLSTVNCPFLGLTYLGHAAEAEHLRDYEREARDAHNREQKRLREWHRSSKDALIQGYFDGSYARYLKGE